MRRLGLLAAATVALAGCGGSVSHTVTVTTSGAVSPALDGAVAPAHGRTHGGRGVTSSAPGGAGAAGTPAGGAAGTPAGGAATPASPANFVSSADAICRSYRATVGAAGQATTLVAQERVFKTLVGSAEHAVARLRALSAPAADAAAFGRFTSLTASAISEFVVAQSRSHSTQESAGVTTESQDFAAFQRAGRAATAAGAAARRLGLRVCGAAGSDWL